MKIDGLNISYSERPKIIAEIGINHNGSLDAAKKISELAAEAGADIIKTQLHIPEEEMSMAAKSLIPKHCDSSIFEIIDQCSLKIDEEFELKRFIDDLGCIYLSTPFSAKAANILGGEFEVKAFKIGSGECNNPTILDAAVQYHVPLIISTGMNSLSSCQWTYDYVYKNSNIRPILMHTTNLYPTPKHLVRLGGIAELQSIAGIDNVGLSDHTNNNLACIGSVVLGTVLLERHFTDTLDRTGPDIMNSMDPAQLKELRCCSEEMFLMRGGSKMEAIPEEQDTRDFAFATIVATKFINAGDSITTENSTPKRPGCGDFQAKDHVQILGMKVRCSIETGTHILKTHLLYDL